jgi:hypothetical protein
MLLDIFDVNNTNLAGFEVELVDVFEDRTIKRTEIIEVKSPDGSRGRAYVTPRLERHLRMVASGQRLRHEYFGGELDDIYWFDGSKWTKSEPGRKRAVIRKPDQMAGQAPLDYRERPGQQLKWPLATILTTWTINKCRGPTEEGGATIDFSAPADQRLQIDFSQKYDLLPERSVLRYPDGTVCQVVEMEYRHVPERQAWLAESATSRFFPTGTTREPTSDDWTIQQSIQVERFRLLSAAEATSLLSVSLPIGFRVEDLTRPVLDQSKVERLPEKVQEHHRFAFIWFNLAILAVLGFAFTWKRIRDRRPPSTTKDRASAH